MQELKIRSSQRHHISAQLGLHHILTYLKPFVRAVAVSFALYLGISILIDGIYPYIAVNFVELDTADILIVDINGILEPSVIPPNVSVIKGLNLELFRMLGLAKAKVIVFLGHGLELTEGSLFLNKGDFALETSSRGDIWAVLKYPLMVLSGSIVRGKPFNLSDERIAVTGNILRFSISFKGKIVVLLTCGMGNIEKFAKSLLDNGAVAVAYSSKPLSLEKARRLVELIASSFNKTEVLLQELEENGLKALSSPKTQ